jgi:hypothetical protein
MFPHRGLGHVVGGRDNPIWMSASESEEESVMDRHFVVFLLGSLPGSTTYIQTR